MMMMIFESATSTVQCGLASSLQPRCLVGAILALEETGGAPIACDMGTSS